MTTLLPYDELNAFRILLENKVRVDEEGRKRFEEVDEEELDDLIYTLMLLSYMRGNEIADQEIGETTQVDLEKLKEAIEKLYDGKDAFDRVREYFQDVDVEAIIRVAETEAHRLYNTGIHDAGAAVKIPLNKTWATMLDDRVRETHWYLEGMSLPFEERFYTIDGDSALYPGGFARAENNVNCRCELILSPQ